MTEFKDIIPQIQAIVARYLDGIEPFDAAAHRIAVLLRATRPTAPPLGILEPQDSENRPQHLSIKNLSIAEWADPNAPYMPVLHLGAGTTFYLAPGRSEAEEAKADALFDEALRRCAEKGGGAA